jgi:hypothetical protein
MRGCCVIVNVISNNLMPTFSIDQACCLCISFETVFHSRRSLIARQHIESVAGLFGSNPSFLEDFGSYFESLTLQHTEHLKECGLRINDCQAIARLK